MARYATSVAHPCVVVTSGQQRAALAPLPPAALRLPAATVELMDCFGLGRIESLYALSPAVRSEEHTSELQSLMRISYAVFCLKKKKKNSENTTPNLTPLSQKSDVKTTSPR